MSERTVTVKGEGRVAARPDEVHILLGLTAQEVGYHAAVEAADRRCQAILAAVRPCGIPPEEVKTTAYGVETVYEGRPDREGNYQNHFAGYRCTHRLKIAIPLEIERLGRVLAAITDGGAKAELELRFTVGDTDALRDRALAAATAMARHRAALLAGAAGQQLGELLQIQHGGGLGEVYAPVTLHSPRAMALHLQPDDLEVTDTVTLTWALV